MKNTNTFSALRAAIAAVAGLGLVGGAHAANSLTEAGREVLRSSGFEVVYPDSLDGDLTGQYLHLRGHPACGFEIARHARRLIDTGFFSILNHETVHFYDPFDV